MTFMTALLKIVVEKNYLFGNATPRQPLNQERNRNKKLLACRTKNKILFVLPQACRVCHACDSFSCVLAVCVRSQSEV